MKDKVEEHFEFVHHNVLAEDMNDGQMEYVKFGEVGMNNRVSLSHSNILQRPHQWAQFHMKKHLGVLFLTLVLHVQEWAILPESNMGDPLRSAGRDVKRHHPFGNHDEPT